MMPLRVMHFVFQERLVRVYGVDKVIAAMPDDRGSVPRICMVEGTDSHNAL